MERTGIVKSVEGEWLEIEFCRPADCEKCNACHGGQKMTSLRIRGKANVGDTAVVSLDPSVINRASAIAYAIPVAGLLLGILLGDKLFPDSNSLGGALGGVIGVSLTGIVLWLTERKRKQNPMWEPKLMRVIPATPNNN